MLYLHQLCTRVLAHGLLHAGDARLGVEVGSVDPRQTEKSPSDFPRGTHVYPYGDCYTGDWAFNLPQGYGDFYTCLAPRPSKGVKKVIPGDPASCPTLVLPTQDTGIEVSAITLGSIATVLTSDTKAWMAGSSERPRPLLLPRNFAVRQLSTQQRRTSQVTGKAATTL